jgi:hypothetical protein
MTLKHMFRINIIFIVLVTATLAVPRQRESPQIDTHEVKCKKCSELVGTPTIHQSSILSSAGANVVQVETGRPWLTVRLDIVNAGPGCSSDRYIAMVTGAVVRRLLSESRLTSFGVTTNLNNSVLNPDITVTASGPFRDYDRWLQILVSTVFSPAIGTVDLDGIKRNVIQSMVKIREQPLQRGLMLADMNLTEIFDVDAFLRSAEKNVSGYSIAAISSWHRDHYRITNTRVGLVSPVGVSGGEFSSAGDGLGRSGHICESDNSVQVSPSPRNIDAEAPYDAIIIVGSAPTTTPRERIILVLANNLLGAGSESRFRKGLRDRDGLSYDVTSSFDPAASGEPWTISATASPINFAHLTAALATETELLAKQGPTLEELAWAKESYLNEAAMNSENPLRQLNEAMSGVHRDASLFQMLKGITPSDIAAAISKTFLSQKTRIVVVGPKIDMERLGASLDLFSSSNTK